MKRTNIKNWSILAISNIAGQALGMLAIVRIVRELGVDAFGQYSLLLVYAGVGAVIATLGMRNIIIKELSQYPGKTKRLTQIAIVLQCLLVIPIAFGIYEFLQFSNEFYFLLYVIMIIIVLDRLIWQMFECVSFSQREIVLPAVVNILERVLWVVFIWLLPSTYFNLGNIAIAFGCVQSMRSVGLYYVVKGCGLLVGKGEEGARNVASDLIQKSLPLYWVALLTLGSTLVPIVFLSMNSCVDEVGYFSASLKIVQPIQMMILTLMAVLLPSLSKASNDSALFVLTIKKSLIFIVCFGSVACFIITVLNDEICGFLFGIKYALAAENLVFQLWFTLLLAIFNLIGTSLIAIERQHLVSKLATVYALVAVPILWTASFSGALGLSIGFMIMGIVNFIYHWFFFQKAIGNVISHFHAISLLVIVGGAFVSSYYISEFHSITFKLVVVVIVLVISGIGAYKLNKQRGGLL